MPIYKVGTPDGKVHKFEGPEGLSQDQVLEQANFKLSQGAAEQVQPDFTVGEMATRSLVRGGKRVASTFGDVLPAMVGSALGAEDYAKRQLQEAAETEKEIQDFYSPQYESRKDVKSISDAFGFALETIAEQGANLATILGTGGVGGAIGKRAATKAAEKFIEKQGKKQVGKQLDDLAVDIAKKTQKGQNVGVFLGSYSLNAPEVFQNIYEQTGKLEPAAASIAGIINASLDSILPATILKNLSQPGRATIVEKVLVRSGMQPKIAQKAANNFFTKVGSGVTTEGLTESAQEAVSVAAEKLVADSASVWDSDDFDRLIEAGVRGAVAGGGFRGISAGIEKIQEKRLENKVDKELDAGEKEVQTVSPDNLEPDTKIQGNVLELTPQRLREAGIKTTSPQFRELSRMSDGVASLSDPEVYNYVKGLTKLGLGEDGTPITKNKKGEALPEAEIRRNKEARQAAVNLLKGVTEPTPTQEVITDEQQDTTDTKGLRTARSLPEFTGEGIALPGQPGIGVSPRVGRSIGTTVDSTTDSVEPLGGGKGDVDTALKGRQEVLDTTRPIEERALIMANRIQAVDPGNEFINILREGVVTEEDIAVAQTTLEEIQATEPQPVQEEVQEVKEEVQEVPDVTEENYDSLSNAYEQTEQEQKLREQLLDDPQSLEELAAQENIPVEEMQKIVEDNYNKLKPYSQKLKQKVNSRPYKNITNKRRQQAKQVNPEVATQAVESDTSDVLETQAAQETLPKDEREADVEDEPTKSLDQVDQKNYEKTGNLAGEILKKLKPLAPKQGETIRNFISNFKPWVQSMYLGFLSLPQLEELYGKQLSSLKTLLNNLQNRASLQDKYRRSVELLVVKGKNITKKYNEGILNKWNKTVLEMSRQEIDPRLADSDPAVKDSQLYKDFVKLPKDLQDLAIEYAESYEEYGRQLLYFLTQRNPTAAQQIREQFEKKRVKFYHPLLREGDYWLSYDLETDEGIETVKKSFKSVRERALAVEQAKKEGAIDVKTFMRPRYGEPGAIPDTALLNKILDTVESYGKNSELTAEQTQELKEQLYEDYLDMFPAESIRQQSRRREGFPGYMEDVVFAYQTTATKMVNQLANMEYRPEIGAAMTDIANQAKDNGDEALIRVSNEVQKQQSFLMNPVASRWSSFAGYSSYLWFIAGNASSALVNLTQIPGVVVPILGGTYGYDKATAALARASSMYTNGGFDNNREYFRDWTTMAGKNFDQQRYGKLFERLIETVTVRRGVGHELTAFRRDREADIGNKAKVEAGLGWMFQNSERANREITAIANFDLALENGATVEEAIQEAIDNTVKAHSHALPEAGPRLFQNNFGKVAFTFKRFAQSQVYLVSRLFYLAFRTPQGAPEEEVRQAKITRDIARRQLIGVYGTMFMLAGAQGMPFYGAVNALASLLFDDDDVPFDFDEYVRESIGDLGYKGPLNKMLNVDIASRTGFNGLLWREDPRRLAEVGFPTYFIEHFFGPAYSIAVNMGRAGKDLANGDILRSVENASPSFIRSMTKSFRLGTEGARNRQGTKIIDDPNAYNLFMQFFGLSDADLSEAYARANAMKTAERRILNRKTSLMNKYWLASQEGDVEGMRETREQMNAFNRVYPGQITPESVKRSMSQRQRRQREAIDGVTISNKLKNKIIDEYGS
jgi:rRNA maturation endonuclease Nob1